MLMNIFIITLEICIIHFGALTKQNETKDLYGSDTNKTRGVSSLVRMSKGKTSNV